LLNINNNNNNNNGENEQLIQSLQVDEDDFEFSPPNNKDNADKGQRKLARSANHLLNFQYTTPPAASPLASPLPPKKYSIQSLAFKRERFLQAKYVSLLAKLVLGLTVSTVFALLCHLAIILIISRMPTQ